MGFVLLGLMTLNQIGLTGAVLQMFSHGVIAGLLFAIVGRMVYDRTHTRQFGELEHMHLLRRLPFAAWAFVIAGMASMGLPGFSGFVAELQVLVGSWHADAVVDGCGRRRHRDRCGLYVARAAEGLLHGHAADGGGSSEDGLGRSWARSRGLRCTGFSLLTAASLVVGVYPQTFCSTRSSRQSRRFSREVRNELRRSLPRNAAGDGA